MKRSDEFWMRQCLALAKNGNGNVSPNPLVGCVIVRNNRKIAEGYHEYFGGPHAEVNAIKAALLKKKNLKGATLYVNLEPCSHFGKTPPCVDAIILHEFARVVIGTMDPNPKVAGTGIRKLRSSNIKCKVGVLKNEAQLLNEHFIKYISTGIPFVSLKAAQTSDGFIARDNGSSGWITNKRSRMYVHHLRTMHDAILIGASTVTKDDPLLTVRHLKGNNPVRVIIDGRLSSAVDSKVFTQPPKTLLYVSETEVKETKHKIAELTARGIEIIQLQGRHGRLNIKSVLKDLAHRNIASVFVEGGQKIYSACISAKAVDKLYLFTAKKKFGSGLKTFAENSVSFKKRIRTEKRFGTDVFQEYDITFP